VPAPGPGSCRSAWTQTGHVLERYEGRIAELEDRLADTDEGMSQNAAVQAAKIRELDSEVRKLWDNVWKRSKERLGVLEASSKRFASAIAANQQTIAATQQQLGKAREDLAALQRVGGDLERLMTTARKSSQARSSASRMRSTGSTWNWRVLKSASAVTRNGSVPSTPSARAPTPVSASCRPPCAPCSPPVAPELHPVTQSEDSVDDRDPPG
jgi:DNA repair exonuclease SbcCD ATPase subunit